MYRPDESDIYYAVGERVKINFYRRTHIKTQTFRYIMYTHIHLPWLDSAHHVYFIICDLKFNAKKKK